MCDLCSLRRRDFLKGAFGTVLGAATGGGLFSALPALAQTSPAPAVAPPREFVLRGGHVLTMNAAGIDLPAGDVHIRDGIIVAVGENISAAGAEIIDAADMIVMPGFVETHWHLWNTALRGAIRADDPKAGYFPLTLRLGPKCTPQDAYASVRLGAAEGLMSGITTLHNWAHNIRTPEHANAELQALKDMGIRSRFSYGWGQDLPLTSPMNLADLTRVQKEWGGSPNMLRLGAALRSPTPGSRGAVPIDVLKVEVDGLRKLGLPMTMHTGVKGLVDVLASIGALGPDMMLVHAQGLSEGERRAVAYTKLVYSMSPVIELSFSAVRSGTIQYEELKTLEVPLGLSIDSSGASASADFFNVMRALMWSDWQRSGAPLRLPPRRIVQLATIDGARLMGLDKITGSLEPGKRADIITVRKLDLNMAPVQDPYYSLVFSGQPSNIDMVVADGRIVRRNGAAVGIDVNKIVSEAIASANGILSRG